MSYEDIQLLLHDNEVIRRLDPDHPSCPGCGRRDAPRMIRKLIHEVDGAVCRDCWVESSLPAANGHYKPIWFNDPALNPHPDSWLAGRWEGRTIEA